MVKLILKVVPGRICRVCFKIFRKRGPAIRCDECQREYRKKYMREYMREYMPRYRERCREKLREYMRKYMRWYSKCNRIKMRYLWRISKAKQRYSRYTHPLSIVKDEHGNLRIKAALDLERFKQKNRK